MSSTLFRLYRSLGGDSRSGAGPHKDARELAAEHTVALIMAGIGLFGAATASVVRTAEDFVSSLVAADSEMPALTIKGRTRYGGMAHKVMRWAFERQGAYPGTGSPEWEHNGPGLPPDVDIFIAGKRSGERGGYEPVTCADEQHFADPRSLWVRNRASGTVHQDPVGGQVNFVFAKAGNRGKSDAAATTARVWCAKLVSGRIPRWTDPAWLELTPASPYTGSPINVPGGSTGVIVGAFRFPGVVRSASYAILAEITCATDPSNLDATAALPCATAPCDVEELVAFDNNLGLRIVTAV